MKDLKSWKIYLCDVQYSNLKIFNQPDLTVDGVAGRWLLGTAKRRSRREWAGRDLIVAHLDRPLQRIIQILNQSATEDELPCVAKTRGNAMIFCCGLF